MSVWQVRADRFRQQAIPPTWEVPLLIALLGIGTAVMIPLLVQGIAFCLMTEDFAWPTGEVPAALAALAHGRFGGGLPPDVATRLPANQVLWAGTAAVEVTAATGAFLAAPRLADIMGASHARGLATTAHARKALGSNTLRRRATVIRPDLATPTRGWRRHRWSDDQ